MKSEIVATISKHEQAGRVHVTVNGVTVADDIRSGYGPLARRIGMLVLGMLAERRHQKPRAEKPEAAD